MSNSDLANPLSWRDSWCRFYISGGTVYQYLLAMVFDSDRNCWHSRCKLFSFSLFNTGRYPAALFDLHAIVVISNKSIFSFCRYILALLSCVGRRFVVPSIVSTWILFPTTQRRWALFSLRKHDTRRFFVTLRVPLWGIPRIRDNTSYLGGQCSCSSLAWDVLMAGFFISDSLTLFGVRLFCSSHKAWTCLEWSALSIFYLLFCF